jgi:hypothetical protein
LILTFARHKGGYVHIILIGAISVFVIQLTAYRKTQYHKTAAGRTDQPAPPASAGSGQAEARP